MCHNLQQFLLELKCRISFHIQMSVGNIFSWKYFRFASVFSVIPLYCKFNNRIICEFHCLKNQLKMCFQVSNMIGTTTHCRHDFLLLLLIQTICGLTFKEWKRYMLHSSDHNTNKNINVILRELVCSGFCVEAR